MRWLIRNSRLGSCLALAAVALQMVVSLGHVHPDGIHRSDPTVAVASPGTHTAPQSLTAPHPGNDADDDYCPICATIYLAANSFVPSAPQLPVPLVSQAVEHFDRIAVVVVSPRRSPFQSRAPPLA